MSDSQIDNILLFFTEASSLEFDGERYVIDQVNKPAADKFNINYEEYGSKLILKLKSYFNGENTKFSELIESEVRSADIFQPLLLLSAKGTIIKYSPSDAENPFTVYGTIDDKLLLKFKNTISYFRLFNLFKSEAFCDYYNDANTEIVIYSSINGIIKIKYDAIPTIATQIDFSSKIIGLIEKASSLEISPFFKNALFTVSKGSGIIQLNDIIAQAEEVIAITKRDYELVSKKFDFEKFRDSLYKEKEKFFSNIRDIVSKIFGQAVGIPISISASVFATYKVSGEPVMLLLVWLAFGFYTGFYIKIQFIYKADLIEVEKDIEEAFLLMNTRSGLEPNVIEAEKNKIERKIKSTKQIIDWLISLVAFLSLLVTIYIWYEIISNESLCLIKILLRL
jgi:hypothetical protein